MSIQLYRQGQNEFYWRIILGFTAFAFVFGLISVFVAFPVSAAQPVTDIVRNFTRILSLFLIQRIQVIAPGDPLHLEIAKALSSLALLAIAAQTLFQFVLQQFVVVLHKVVIDYVTTSKVLL